MRKNIAEQEKAIYWIEEFFNFALSVQQKSAATVKEYKYDVRTFCRWLKSQRENMDPDLPFSKIDISDLSLEELNQVRLSDIYSYVAWLANERDNSASTRSRKISSLRTFFDYLYSKANVIDSNPTTDMELPKRMKSVPRYLTMDESLQLLASAIDDDDPNSERDFCILALFLNCGIRLSELVNINLSDIREDKITVMGKGSKERTIYLNQLANQALQAWLKVRPEAPSPHHKALFLSRNRRRISQRAVENVVKKYLQKAGLDTKRYSPHKLRHTAATLMYQEGDVDLRSLQKILGHESVATTEIYTHISDKMLKDAVKKNPLNEFNKEDLSK